ncbi:hypothetical protein MMC18_008978 [Xylographa bjoerkii]|nr:hypothetical protein [Xylographa bjoerkii]
MSSPNDHGDRDDEEGPPDATLRERSGGIYTWQPTGAADTGSTRPALIIPYWNTNTSSTGFWAQSWRKILKFITLKCGSSTLPHILVFAGTLAGIIISILVPPVGVECGTIGEISIYSAWLFSFLLDLIPRGDHHKPQFYFAFGKDIFITILTMGGIVATQVGVLNQCAATLSGERLASRCQKLRG